MTTIRKYSSGALIFLRIRPSFLFFLAFRNVYYYVRFHLSLKRKKKEKERRREKEGRREGEERDRRDVWKNTKCGIKGREMYDSLRGFYIPREPRIFLDTGS